MNKSLNEIDINDTSTIEMETLVSDETFYTLEDKPPEDRYSRLKLISWWDQEILRRARIMVIGAGAIGNELLKNLALVGIGNIFIVDMDNIENSNLSRSILFRQKDEGRSKAEVAAERVKEINPDIKVQFFNGNVIYDLGLGVFKNMDVIIGGLDNREARLAINRICWKLNKPWIDGAIEVFNGIARVFMPPDGACYECTLNDMDYQLMNIRHSCALLTREQMQDGRVPTTPTTASVIASIQVQEALKLLHNREDLPILKSKAFFFNGLTHDSFVIEYDRKEDCMSHESYGEIIQLAKSIGETTISEMLDIIRHDISSDAILEFDREIVYGFRCNCGYSEETFKLLGKVYEGDAICPNCGEARAPLLTHSIQGWEHFLDLKLSDLGLPLFDIVRGRDGLNMKYYEFSDDARNSLGELFHKTQEV